VDTGVVGGGEEDSVGQDERVEGPPLVDDRVPGVLRPQTLVPPVPAGTSGDELSSFRWQISLHPAT